MVGDQWRHHLLLRASTCCGILISFRRSCLERCRRGLCAESCPGTSHRRTSPSPALCHPREAPAHPRAEAGSCTAHGTISARSCPHAKHLMSSRGSPCDDPVGCSWLDSSGAGHHSQWGRTQDLQVAWVTLSLTLSLVALI